MLRGGAAPPPRSSSQPGLKPLRPRLWALPACRALSCRLFKVVGNLQTWHSRSRAGRRGESWPSKEKLRCSAPAHQRIRDRAGGAEGPAGAGRQAGRAARRYGVAGLRRRLARLCLPPASASRAPPRPPPGTPRTPGRRAPSSLTATSAGAGRARRRTGPPGRKAEVQGGRAVRPWRGAVGLVAPQTTLGCWWTPGRCLSVTTHPLGARDRDPRARRAGHAFLRGNHWATTPSGWMGGAVMAP